MIPTRYDFGYGIDPWEDLLEFAKSSRSLWNLKWISPYGFSGVSMDKLEPSFQNHCQEVIDIGFQPSMTEFIEIRGLELEKITEPLVNRLGYKNVQSRIFILPPGRSIPTHRDDYHTYQKEFKVPWVHIQRTLFFLEDWKPGHFFHLNNSCISSWSQGDSYELKAGIFHTSANSGFESRFTLNITGTKETDVSKIL